MFLYFGLCFLFSWPFRGHPVFFFSGLHWQADKPLPPVGTEIRACDYNMCVVSMRCYQGAGDAYKLYLASHPRLKSVLWTDMLKHSLLLGGLTVTHNLKLSWSAGPFFLRLLTQ